MARDLYIDIETFSSVDLSKAGVYKYVGSPDFEILVLGYSLDRGPVKVVDLAQGEPYPEEFLQALMDPGCRKHAHNAPFERLCFRRVGYDVPASQWWCTMVKSAYCGLPLSLDMVSKVLDLKDKKLETGKALIRYFSTPCKPTKVNGGRTRNLPHHAPEKWEMYKEYNRYDVLAEIEIDRRLEAYTIPAMEREIYRLDQDINDRGILVDRELVDSAIAVDREYTAGLVHRATELTGLENPNSVPQLKAWVERRAGCTVPSLDKEALADLAERFSGDSLVSEIIDIRRKLARTSVKKYQAMDRCAMEDGRARGTLQFYGANRTGRWAGRLVQLQNLPKNHIRLLTEARELIKARDLDMVDMLYGDVPDILSQLVRTALVAPEGKVFAVADFSAIEARVISWLANEKWRMDVFHGDGKIYEATGSKMFNVPVSAITKGSVLRDKSKISELALGYGGGVGALAKMGGERMGLDEREMKSLVSRWRSANPAIVNLWKELEECAKGCLRYGKRIVCTPRRIVMERDRDYFMIGLPSGRKLFYREARLTPNGSIVYMGLNQVTRQWAQLDTYGGKLTENIVQAIARDLLANSMLALDAAGYPIVSHIHDECVTEVPAEGAKDSLARMSAIMGVAPGWASDLPLRADGYVTPYYMKD